MFNFYYENTDEPHGRLIRITFWHVASLHPLQMKTHFKVHMIKFFYAQILTVLNRNEDMTPKFVEEIYSLLSQSLLVHRMNRLAIG